MHNEKHIDWLHQGHMTGSQDIQMAGYFLNWRQWHDANISTHFLVSCLWFWTSPSVRVIWFYASSSSIVDLFHYFQMTNVKWWLVHWPLKLSIISWSLNLEIIHHHHHHHIVLLALISLTLFCHPCLYHPSLLGGLPGYILYLHRAVVYRF